MNYVISDWDFLQGLIIFSWIGNSEILLIHESGKIAFNCIDTSFRVPQVVIT